MTEPHGAVVLRDDGTGSCSQASPTANHWLGSLLPVDDGEDGSSVGGRTHIGVRFGRRRQKRVRHFPPKNSIPIATLTTPIEEISLPVSRTDLLSGEIRGTKYQATCLCLLRPLAGCRILQPRPGRSFAPPVHLASRVSHHVAQPNPTLALVSIKSAREREPYEIRD